MADHQASDEELREQLTPDQYHVLREGGTELPGSGELLYNFEKGMYVCPVCSTPLFKSEAKFESNTPGLVGWPSFCEAASSDAIELKTDTRYGMDRTEIVCKTCGSHLGHLFDDPNAPNGKHYCINSAALEFKKQD
jgi:peptide-methionine (R)-S-oxide reductase